MDILYILYIVEKLFFFHHCAFVFGGHMKNNKMDLFIIIINIIMLISIGVLVGLYLRENRFWL